MILRYNIIKFNEEEGIKMEKKINSVDLYEKISIETWLRIADGVSKLNITNGNDGEFKENLKKLKKILIGTEVSLEEKDRYAKHFFDVGLATLLQSIYDIKSQKNKKEHFAEQIYALKELGIKNIRFNGDISVEGILTSKDYYKRNVSYLHKIFTDGSFCVENTGGYSHMFEMTDLRDINYFLYINLVLRQENEITKKNLAKANATLLHFDGVFPNKEEIMAIHHPDLEMDSSILEWQVTNKNRVKQHFKSYVRK